MEWKLKRVTLGFWKNFLNQRKYFSWLATEIGIKEKNDWYHIRTKDISNNYGGSLLLWYYDDSISKALISIYPEYNFLPWKFYNVNSNFWNSQLNSIQYWNWLKKKLFIKQISDWDNISRLHITNLGGRTWIDKYKGLKNTINYHLILDLKLQNKSDTIQQ